MFRSVPDGWREVDVDLNHHVHNVTVDDEEQMFELLQTSTNKAFDHNKPLWEIVRVTNKGFSEANNYSDPNSNHFEMYKQHHVLLLRVDHCVADGVGLVEVSSRMFTNLNNEPISHTDTLIGLARRDAWGVKRLARRERRSHTDSRRQKFLIDIVRSFSWIKHRALAVPVKMIMSLPWVLYSIFGFYDGESACTLSMARRKKGVLFSENQKISICRPFSFSFVRKIKQTFGVSVNDVVMSCFAGAIRRYNTKHSDEPPTKLRCRCLVPFAFVSQRDSIGKQLKNVWCEPSF